MYFLPVERPGEGVGGSAGGKYVKICILIFCKINDDADDDGSKEKEREEGRKGGKKYNNNNNNK